MSVSQFLQYMIIAAAVLASAVVVMRKQFPNATRRVRMTLAVLMLREGRPGWIRRLGMRVAPDPAAVVAACGGCSSCEGPPR